MTSEIKEDVTEKKSSLKEQLELLVAEEKKVR